jgi:predicted enzyme related to lactoylglutathione lyase
MGNDGEQGMPDTWTIHLHSDDADRTVAAAREHGGEVYVEPMDVTQNGRFAMLGDPGGAGIGVWQPREVSGFEIRGEPGAAAWFELHTAAYDESVAFYREVFGWDAHTAADEPEFRYTTLGEGEGMLAGIMAAGETEGWSVYFEVEDADATCALAEELGGKVVHAPEDTPYGRLATLLDPTGTRLKLIQQS